MALSVLNNIASLAAQNQLTITNGNLQKALFQLSSGSRINTGADDAAGLAIADGLHANITALTQSARNANDGVGELQVADGSLAAVTTLLNRAVTIATEAATGTVSDPQRVALNDEFTAIKAEIDRVGSKTNYNGGQVFRTDTLNVFLSDSSSNSNSLIGVATGVLSSIDLGLGGAVASTGTLSQKAGSAAVAASDVFTGAAFTASVAASTTLTVTGGNPQIVANDALTVGGKTYTFKAVVASANDVLVGASDTASLLNLKAAINAAAGGAGTAYGIGTVANANVNAGTATATTLVVTANINGIGNGTNTGNSVASTVGTGGAHLAFTAATLAGGTAGSTVAVGGQTYTFVAVLGATATANEVISTSQASGLTNLTAAVNGAGGSNYSSNTVRNANVTAATLVAGTSLTFTANVAGAGGNFISGTATSGSFASLNFTGGVDTGAAPVAQGGDTVTVGTQTYTFVTALSSTPTANEVLVGATEAASLTNLANAVNGGSGAGASYGSPTVKNTFASAAATPTSVVFTALTKGVTGNGIATSATGTSNSFANNSLLSGTAGSINDLSNIADATAALTTINAAIQSVAALRGTIGATVNRLQSAAGVITNQVQNLTGAEDGVRAADIPSTVATLAKYSILEQTGISSLAQANQQQQLVLKLLQ
jgi:flagellin